MNPNEKYPEHITRNIAPDGEFICIMGPGIEVNKIPPLEIDWDIELPKRMSRTPFVLVPSRWERFKDGFLYALYLGWVMAQILVVFIAVLVAATLLGWGVWFYMHA